MQNEISPNTEMICEWKTRRKTRNKQCVEDGGYASREQGGTSEYLLAKITGQGRQIS